MFSYMISFRMAGQMTMPREYVALCGVRFFRTADFQEIRRTRTIQEMAFAADKGDELWQIVGCGQMMTFENNTQKPGSGCSLVSLGGSILFPASGKLFPFSFPGRLRL